MRKIVLCVLSLFLVILGIVDGLGRTDISLQICDGVITISGLYLFIVYLIEKPEPKHNTYDISDMD